MSVTIAAIINGILAVGVLAALAYVCRIPFRLARVVPAAASETRDERDERQQLAA